MSDYIVAVLLGCVIGATVAVVSWNAVLRSVASELRNRK